MQVSGRRNIPGAEVQAGPLFGLKILGCLLWLPSKEKCNASLAASRLILRKIMLCVDLRGEALESDIPSPGSVH